MSLKSIIINQIRSVSTETGFQLKNTHLFNHKLTPPRQAWLETFIGQKSKKLEILELHPCVFGVFPRPDHITKAVQWQKNYRKVDYLSMPTRNELPGGTRKPWPQKGTGRARHGSVNSPIFLRGGWARGPRGPTTNFYVLPHGFMVSALQSCLTMKLAQDDLKIVGSIDDYQNTNPEKLDEEFDMRRWGPSVLIVDKRDIFPEALVEACKKRTHVNLMPTYGINALSLIKHETLVITHQALREVEDKLLYQQTRVDLINVTKPKQAE